LYEEVGANPIAEILNSGLDWGGFWSCAC